MTDNKQGRACPDCPESLGYAPAYWAVYQSIQWLIWNRVDLPEYKQVTTFLCERPPRSGLGHDSLDAHRAAEKLGWLAGLPKDWATCKTCHGSGSLESAITKAEQGE